MYGKEKKDEARRLRVKERKSLKEIASMLGVSKGTASVWLREHPLTEEEILKRHEHVVPPNRKPGVTDREESKFHKIAQAEGMGKQQKAKLAEAAVLYRLVLHGMSPFGSVFDGDKTDWLVEVPGNPKAQKIQVKWASLEDSGSPRVRLRCSDGRSNLRKYLPGEFDFIVGYDFYSDTCYVWSFEELASYKSMVSVCDEAAERWDKILT